jgi:peroxiredoxin
VWGPDGALQRGPARVQRFNAELLGISVDGVWCHAAFSRDRKLHFPLLADFEPKGAMAKLYGAFCDGEGIVERTTLSDDRDHVPLC